MASTDRVLRRRYHGCAVVDHVTSVNAHRRHFRAEGQPRRTLNISSNSSSRYSSIFPAPSKPYNFTIYFLAAIASQTAATASFLTPTDGLDPFTSGQGEGQGQDPATMFLLGRMMLANSVEGGGGGEGEEGSKVEARGVRFGQEKGTGVLLDSGLSTNLSASGGVPEGVKNHTVMVSCLMFAAGVVGNLLALFVLATSSAEQRKSSFYKLVAGLAVTDLLGTVATSPVVIAVYLNDFRWVGGEAVCHYFSFAMIFAGFATMLIVCAMSVERFICVRHPYLYHTRLSRTKFAHMTLLACWVFSGTIALLPLLGVGTNIRQFPSTWCFFDYLSRKPSDMVFNCLYAVVALVCIVVTFVCNVVVIYTLLTLGSRQKRLAGSCADKGETTSGGSARTEKGKAIRWVGIVIGAGGGGGGGGGGIKRRTRATTQRFAEVQMMIMLIGVTVIFTFCFAPLMIFVLICQTSLEFDTQYWVLLLIRVASFNPILDPWVYILCRRELAWRLVRLCRWALRLPPLHPPLPGPRGPAHVSLLAPNGGLGAGGLLLNGSSRKDGADLLTNGETFTGGRGSNTLLAPASADGSSGCSFGSQRRDGNHSGWEDPYNPSCLAFCYQCLCLPPVPRLGPALPSLPSQRLSLGYNNHAALLATARNSFPPFDDSGGRATALAPAPAPARSRSADPLSRLSASPTPSWEQPRSQVLTLSRSAGRLLGPQTPSPSDRLLLLRTTDSARSSCDCASLVDKSDV